MIYLEVWCGQIGSSKEQLVDPCGIWRGEEDLSRGRGFMISQNELLALRAMVKCCHNLEFLLALLLCNNLTQPCTLIIDLTQLCLLPFEAGLAM